MIGLGGTRVIVVDDDHTEAIPILTALSKKSISAAFFDGSENGLPSKKDRLSGVRLAILDMDLIGGGVSDKSKASALVNTLEKIMSPVNGPYAVLAWTRHPELLELFEEYVFSAPNLPNPILTVMIEKAECKNKKDDFNLKTISRKLEESIMQFSPSLFLQVWEEKCFASATEVTNELSELSSSETSDLNQWRNRWKKNMLQLIHAMARAEADKHLDKDSCLIRFYNSLNPLHADRMESNSAKISENLSRHAEEILGASADCGIERKAAVNSMLHLAFDNLQPFYAGNIYVLSGKKKPKWIPSMGELINDLVQLSGNTAAERKKEIESASRLSIIEASPICDHAQKNIRMARFVVGLLVPSDHRKKLKRNANFVWEFGPVFLKNPVANTGQYYFFFSARHLVTSTIDRAKKMRASARLRGQALTAFQAWFTSHAGRPGMMILS